MADLSREAVLRAAMPVLAEAFAGPPDPRSTHFASTLPDSGVSGRLDARSASAPPAAGRPTAARVAQEGAAA